MKVKCYECGELISSGEAVKRREGTHYGGGAYKIGGGAA